MAACKYKYNPVVDGKKECKVCHEVKVLESEYRFHNATGYYSGTCKECEKKKRRLERPVTNGVRIDSHFIRQKTCSQCGLTKDLNKENFYKPGKKIAKEASAKGLDSVVFDRGGNLYHGRIKAVADGAREGGLQF